MNKWELAFDLLKIYSNKSYQAYIVGGACRDRLLHREIHDIDIATNALPEETIGLFSRTYPIGIKHGTVLVRYKGESFEVTTFRKESEYIDFRHPRKVEFTDSITEDLSRRDFTMNAIALAINNDYMDPFNGIEDLKRGILRTVGHPNDRFKEDPLRIMRGIRFISVLGVSAPLSVIRAMKNNSRYLEYISTERKFDEMNKLIQGDHIKTAFNLTYLTNCNKWLPGLQESDNGHLPKVPYKQLDIKTDEECWASLIIALNIKDPVAFCRSWGMSRQLKSRTCGIIDYFNRHKSQEWTPVSLYHAGKEMAQSISKLLTLFQISHSQKKEQINEMWEHLPIKNRNDVAVKGNDVLKWSDRRPGPWVGEVLSQIETLVIEGKLENTKQQIRKWVTDCLKQRPEL